MLENHHPSTITSIEDKVIEAKEMEEGVSMVSRQEILPYRHCSLHGNDEASLAAEFMRSVKLQMIVAVVKEDEHKRYNFSYYLGQVNKPSYVKVTKYFMTTFGSQSCKIHQGIFIEQ